MFECDESRLPGSEPDCPECGAGPGSLRFLGYIGDGEWFECRHCGEEFEIKKEA